MDRKKYIFFVLLIVPITFILNINLVKDTGITIDINKLFQTSLFDVQNIIEKKLFLVAFNSVITVVVFNLCFSMYIYKDFLVNGPYIFTRIENRNTWILKKVRNLLIYSIEYAFLYVFSMLIICIIRTKGLVDFQTLYIFCSMWFVFCLIMFFTTILTNILAIKYGISIAYVTTYSILIILLGLSINFSSLPFLGKYSILNYVNPMAAFSVYITEPTFVKALFSIYYLLLIVLFSIYTVVRMGTIDIESGVNEE